MASKITLDFYEDKAGKHRWRVRAQNGNVVLASTQGYVTLASAGKNLARAYEMLGALGVHLYDANAPKGGFHYRATLPGRGDVASLLK